MHRVIKDLRASCRYAGAPPFAAKRKTSKGAKGQGHRYEAALGKALGPEWQRGQWFTFVDAAGPGFCQPDFLRELSDCVVVLEAKLRWVPEAHTQLEQLYRPVVERCYRKPVVALAVCKVLVPECNGAIAQTLPSALAAAQRGASVVLHWSGKAPLALLPPARCAPQAPLPSHLIMSQPPSQ